MSINLPTKVRAAIYIIMGVASPVVAYLSINGIISEPEVALYASIMTFVSGLAAINVSDSDETDR
jgi:hypothetical protein